jgi:hypothetical protein
MSVFIVGKNMGSDHEIGQDMEPFCNGSLALWTDLMEVFLEICEGLDSVLFRYVPFIIGTAL